MSVVGIGVGDPAMSAEQIRSLYASMGTGLDQARRRFARALTLPGKILVAPCEDVDGRSTHQDQRADRVVQGGLRVNAARPDSATPGKDI
jgi:hypothetical protein